MLTVFAGSFFGLRTGTKAGAETIRERGAKMKPARFHSGDEVNRVAVVMIAETINERTESPAVLEKRRQIVEKNSRLRIIRHFADQLFQIIHSRSSYHSSRVMLNSFAYCSSGRGRLFDDAVHHSSARAFFQSGEEAQELAPRCDGVGFDRGRRGDCAHIRRGAGVRRRPA